jgi:hypothetical protein
MSKAQTKINAIHNSRYETKEYSIFGYLVGNRPVDITGPNGKKLMASLKKNGWLKSRPAITCKFGSKYLIIDGQHKILIAEQLKIPVVFEVLDISIEEAKSLMVELQFGKSWAIENYVNKYSQEGNGEFLFVANYAKQNAISLSCAANMLYGQLPTSNNVCDYLKDGTYKVKDVAYANKVLSIFKLFRNYKEIKGHSNLLLACGKLAHLKEFDIDRFAKKLQHHSYLVRNAHSSQDFLLMIEEIYNRQSNNKVNIAFLTEQVIKSRHIIKV